MDVKEYADCDATALAALVRRGEVTAEEVYATAREALERVDAELNAVADGPWERPLEHADDAPFAGVPLVIKDLGAHPQGVPIRSGSRLSGEGVVFPFESYLMSRFRSLGFAIAGLSTTPELGYNTNCEALAYGSTRNPWDLTRSAGGSSGGSAALVAAGATPVAHGGDGGGSIRIPAAMNGVVGMKPSRGRISNGPDHQEMLSGLAVEFVFTRTMRDCAAMLDALSGAMPGDKYEIRGPRRPWSEEMGADPGRLRIALHTESWSPTPVDPEVAAVVDAVARELEQLGHHVERATPTVDWDAFVAAMTPLFAATCVEAIDAISTATGNQPGPDTLERTILAYYEYGRELTVLDMAKAMQTVNAAMRTVGEFFTQWDLLLTPTVTTPAPPLGYHDSNDASFGVEEWTRHIFDVCSFTPLFNWSGTPAVSLPLGSSSAGLPIGVQLCAPMCEEARLIQVGSQLETALPWHGTRPGVHAAA